MERWGKQEWVTYIGDCLLHGRFVYRSFFPNKTALLFACDTFRRNGHTVELFFEVVEHGPPCTGVVISPHIETADITIRRDTKLEDVVARMVGFASVRVRGCGTTVQMVNDAVHMAIRDGWYVGHTEMGTLVKIVDGIKQRNTTLMVTLCRGSPGLSSLT